LKGANEKGRPAGRPFLVQRRSALLVLIAALVLAGPLATLLAVLAALLFLLAIAALLAAALLVLLLVSHCHSPAAAPCHHGGGSLFNALRSGMLRADGALRRGVAEAGRVLFRPATSLQLIGSFDD
jgi:hypothetical protein